MSDNDIRRIGIRKAGNAGLVTTTGGNDLLHTLPLTTIQTVQFSARSFIIRKVMWYNNTGAPQTLRIGTLNNVPAFVDRLPTIYCINLFDGEIPESDLPAYEFILDTRVGALGMNGNAYVLASAAAMLVAIEVEEFGA